MAWNFPKVLYTNRENFTGYLYLCNFEKNNSLKTISLRLSHSCLKSSKKARRKFPLERLLIYSKSWKFNVITLLWNSRNSGNNCESRKMHELIRVANMFREMRQSREGRAAYCQKAWLSLYLSEAFEFLVVSQRLTKSFFIRCYIISVFSMSKRFVIFNTTLAIFII